jgi:regulator of protease activity HflC (stomatin/prohibitin superfamily)
LYLTLQMAVREIVGKEKIDTLIENRAGFSSKLTELTSGKASEYGLKLKSADIKDIMFPGEMKKAFAQVVKAQKEGQAALEKARGETAATRWSWECRTVLFHWLSEVKRRPFLRARNLKKRTKSLGSRASQS